MTDAVTATDAQNPTESVLQANEPFQLGARVVYGCDSAPQAVIPGHTELLSRNVEHMMTLAARHNLTECRCSWPVTWSGWDDSMPLVNSELVVTRSQFWFAAQTKRGEIAVESDAASTARLPGGNKAYTVVLDYADLHGDMGTETWMGIVIAANPTDALDSARHNCLADNGIQGTDPEKADYANPTDLACVALLSGRHDDIQHLAVTV